MPEWKLVSGKDVREIIAWSSRGKARNSGDVPFIPLVEVRDRSLEKDDSVSVVMQYVPRRLSEDSARQLLTQVWTSLGMASVRLL